MRERCIAVIAAQTFCPAVALATARSTSSWLARCTLASTSPLAGLMLSKVAPLVEST
jgi:hypothetical protein